MSSNGKDSHNSSKSRKTAEPYYDVGSKIARFKSGRGGSVFENSYEFRKFLADQVDKRREVLWRKVAISHLKDVLEHQISMLRLTRQMNRLLADMTACKFAKQGGFNPNSKQKKPTQRQSKKEYVIFSGGPKGLKYSNLQSSSRGTFRLEIDVRDYTPDQLRISTENSKTMHVKALANGVRRTLKIVSPEGVDIDDVVIHHPKEGILLLEAP